MQGVRLLLLWSRRAVRRSDSLLSFDELVLFRCLSRVLGYSFSINWPLRSIYTLLNIDILL